LRGCAVVVSNSLVSLFIVGANIFRTWDASRRACSLQGLARARGFVLDEALQPFPVAFRLVSHLHTSGQRPKYSANHFTGWNHYVTCVEFHMGY
jgi:hypothetical protein